MTQTSLRSLASLLGLLIIGTLLGPTSWGQVSDTSSPGVRVPDTSVKGAPYVPTKRDIVDRMLRLAHVSSDDVVYDLGSGDGRIVIAAARDYGARGVGIEIDPDLVEEARAAAREAGVADKVEFRRGDLFEADLSNATVVTLYLWPEMNNRLRPKLRGELEPGDRVVSNSFNIDGWRADTTVKIGDNDSLTDFPTPIYLWTLPVSTPSD